MAARKCKFGKVKSGPRKGLCRKRRPARRKASAKRKRAGKKRKSKRGSTIGAGPVCIERSGRTCVAWRMPDGTVIEVR